VRCKGAGAHNVTLGARVLDTLPVLEPFITAYQDLDLANAMVRLKDACAWYNSVDMMPFR
jgi:hypothetical protein